MIKRNKEILCLGGKDGERLYLRSLSFKLANGKGVMVRRTNISGVDMEDLIARAKGRYGLLALFSRPGYRILDFPCGSGYAADLFKEFGVIYHGKEAEKITVEYARRIYGNKNSSFEVNDLCSPNLVANFYDVIGCIEGLEHIEKKCQKPLVASLYEALKPGGTLIISSPENSSGISGYSATNPYHLWELSKKDFLNLLYTKFKQQEVELITYRATLSYGELTTCLFGVCHKPEKK